MLKGIINSKAKEGTAGAWAKKLELTQQKAAQVSNLPQHPPRPAELQNT